MLTTGMAGMEARDCRTTTSRMPIYEYECPNGHQTERVRREADRNEEFDCEDCNERMTRLRIELQKRARVIGGTRQFHRNETHYTKGLG